MRYPAAFGSVPEVQLWSEGRCRPATAFTVVPAGRLGGVDGKRKFELFTL